MKLKVLDLFAGLFGWSIPFIEYGDEVIGIDIKNYGVPKGAVLILQDVKTIDGTQFRNFDLIIGSPPCIEFSDARYRSIHIHGKKPDPPKGFPLIEEFWRIVKEAKPKFYAMENIKALTKYYDRIPQWHFKISKGGKRYLWTNIPLSLVSDFKFQRKIRDIAGWDKTRPLRAKIPYPIAKYIADTVHSQYE